ncbi:MAG: biotin--[acetyl-CoA-carboxylase] ligase, partial [Bacteroidales bacterium]|nr:biotin--[acetyl-CoA-carboxylase] ligase [Bacteroidales bacterium]
MKIIWYDTLLSTNNTMSLYKERFQDRETIVAIEQTAGKGQRGNRWESAPGENLTFSTMLKPRGFAAERAWLISQSVSLGICDFLHIKGLEAKIKWPNDIYVEDRKICGILIENSISGTLLSSSIVGIGLNVNQLSFSEDIPNPISMAMVTGQRYDIKSEIVTLLESVFGRYDTISVKTGTDYL